MPRRTGHGNRAHRGPFRQRITTRMKELGLDRLEQFASYAGIGTTTVHGLIHGRISRHGKPVKPSLETLARLAAALKVPLHELVYELAPEARGARHLGTVDALRLPVKVAGWVGAGSGEDEEIVGSNVWVDASFARGMDLLAFMIRGDSMELGSRPIFDGDLVLVNRRDRGSEGAAVVARLAAGGYVCKLLRDDGYGRKLVSTNPRASDGTPFQIDARDVAEVVGRVIEIRHLEAGIQRS